jgi:hypothetical protein
MRTLASVSIQREIAFVAVLGYLKILLESGPIAIDERFTKLVSSLRTAYESGGKLNKEITSFNDVYDAFGLSLREFHFCRFHVYSCPT